METLILAEYANAYWNIWHSNPSLWSKDFSHASPVELTCTFNVQIAGLLMRRGGWRQRSLAASIANTFSNPVIIDFRMFNFADTVEPHQIYSGPWYTLFVLQIFDHHQVLAGLEPTVAGQSCQKTGIATRLNSGGCTSRKTRSCWTSNKFWKVAASKLRQSWHPISFVSANY